MFETLLESSGSARRRGGETAVSVVLHMVVLAGAVQATERVVAGTSRVLDTTVVFVEPRRAAATPVPAELSPVPSAPEALVEVLPPRDIALGIPPVEIGARAFNAAEVIGPSRAAEMPAGVGAEAGMGVAGVFASAEVDDAALALSQPAPRYPGVLQREGISGYVELDYVIDTTGHAEAGSVRVISATHDAFVESAREAIVGGVYRPARYRGSAVRQLVRQRVLFESR